MRCASIQQINNLSQSLLTLSPRSPFGPTGPCVPGTPGFPCFEAERKLKMTQINLYKNKSNAATIVHCCAVSKLTFCPAGPGGPTGPLGPGGPEKQIKRFILAQEFCVIHLFNLT